MAYDEDLDVELVVLGKFAFKEKVTVAAVIMAYDGGEPKLAIREEVKRKKGVDIRPLNRLPQPVAVWLSNLLADPKVLEDAFKDAKREANN